MKTKKSFPYIALYITAIAAGSLVSFLFKFFTDNFWNVVVPSAIAVGIVDVLNRRKRRKERKV